MVGEWTKSIIDHLYWCAASVYDDDDDIGDSAVRYIKKLLISR